MLIKRPAVPVSPASPRVTPNRPTPPGFGPGGCIPPHPGPVFPLPPVGKTTLSLQDRVNAWGLKGGLEKTLSGIGGAMKLASAKKATVQIGRDGNATGPEGQPLVKVSLSGGRTAYVDPNTNEYYVASKRSLFPFGAQEVRGPLALPKDLEFSNSNFSVADCRQLQLDAGRPPFRRLDTIDWGKALNTDSFGAR